jgi:hypothetical protein
LPPPLGEARKYVDKLERTLTLGLGVRLRKRQQPKGRK